VYESTALVLYLQDASIAIRVALGGSLETFGSWETKVPKSKEEKLHEDVFCT